MTYAKAFPTFPANAMPALPAGFHDASYRNDVCPRYTSDDDRVSIWVDYPDPDAREFRFVCQYRVTLASIDDGIVLDTDKWSEAVEAAVMLANAE
jgi:hypothetical protein